MRLGKRTTEIIWALIAFATLIGAMLIIKYYGPVSFGAHGFNPSTSSSGGYEIVEGWFEWSFSMTCDDCGWDGPKYDDKRADLYCDVRNIGLIKQYLDQGYTLEAIYVEKLKYHIWQKGTGRYIWSLYLNDQKYVDKDVEWDGEHSQSYSADVLSWFNATDTLHLHIYLFAQNKGGWFAECKITLSDPAIYILVYLKAPGA